MVFLSDAELEKLKSRRLREMERQVRKSQLNEPSKTTTEQKKDPWSTLRGRLVDRGEEVLQAAWTQYPDETESIVRQLAQLIETGKFNEKMTGEKLFAVLKHLGLPVKLKTRIVVAEHGKIKSLADKMKGA